MKTKMKTFPSLPLYIVTTVVAIGCVSALPSARKHHPRALFRVPEQDPGILPRMPEQDYGILPRVPEQDYGVLPSVPEQDYGLQSGVTEQDPGILENSEKAVLTLPSTTKQDPGIIPSVSEQDPGILENIEETLGEPCPQGWTRFDDYCYLVSSSIKTWDQAQTYCKSLGGGLVKINSPEENEFVLNLVTEKAPSLRQVWIGLHWHSPYFYWDDHSALVYKNWAPGEPSGKGKEPCVHMWLDGHSYLLPIRAAGYWNDLSCNEKSRFPNGIVCERLP